jgi:peptide deformylase
VIREILKMGDPRLLRVAKPVETLDDPELKVIAPPRGSGSQHPRSASIFA